ncbi:MAG TPA: 1-acyl-sn-glycerol-3-phosphate acyltransferase [Syntrophales bacterium]|nr:1-acyl-sn-glycerol-3-phosphate acyltransferase [Syntrophales bacterium]
MSDTEHYPGSLYPRENFLLGWFVRKALSRVAFADEQADAIRGLAREGVVVHAVRAESQLNSLILRELSLRKDLPLPAWSYGANMLLWQPYALALKGLLNRVNPYRTAYLKRLLTNRQSAVIHLGGAEFLESPEAADALNQVLEAQRALDVPVYIVPEMVTYGRRRETERESVLNILFGQTENTGPLLRVITFLRYANKAQVIAAEPVNVAAFLAEHEGLPAAEQGRRLRQELIERIDAEKTTMVGPVLKSRAELNNLVLKDEDLLHFMDEHARRSEKDFAAVRKEARRYLTEISSDYREMFVEIWDKFLTWLWNDIYDGVVVDREGMARLRDISRRMPFVIIPCHRSHIDYLLLSYVFYKNNIQLPFIAAGTNLMFWPLGAIFRKSGAFFLRRSFKGNPLYAEVFAKYVKTLLREGLPIEFFIEGGRSRTGKMVMPKYGLLSIIMQSFIEGCCQDLAAVPVYIGYDRVIEEKSYLKELGGETKKSESTTDIIKSGGVLRKRYGRVYVNIGEPILLRDYLAAQEKPVPEMTVEERQRLYRKIGYEIVLAIDRVSVVTPFSFVSAGLLCHDRRGIDREELTAILEEFYGYLRHRGVSLASTFERRDRAVAEALELFVQAGLISRLGLEDEIPVEDIEEVVYSLEDDKRLNLEYYKNNILHYFLPLAFVAVSILSSREDLIAFSRILGDYGFFKRLFRHEFIFDDGRSDLDEVNEVLTYLHDRGMIAGGERGEEALIEVKGRGRTNLMAYAGLIHNYLESYWVVVRGCAHLKAGEVPEREFLRRLQTLGLKMFKKGEITRAESLSQANYQNALRFLREQGVLVAEERRDKGEKRETRYLSLAEDRAPLEALRRRLFQFM